MIRGGDGDERDLSRDRNARTMGQSGGHDETLPLSGSASTEEAPTGGPSMVGRYRVLRPLGGGGFGQVYLAHDDDLDRPVAIKVPNRDRIAGPEDVGTFLAEARNVAGLDHPNIVPVYDLGRTDDGLCYIVYKFVEGSDLSDRLGRSAPSHGDAAGLVAAVANALD
jgi:eukaryotic-like serine/threonine-protein kinase